MSTASTAGASFLWRPGHHPSWESDPAHLLQEWRATLWKDIRTDIMEDGTKSFTKEVKALPKGVKDESVFKVGKARLLAAMTFCSMLYCQVTGYCRPQRVIKHCCWCCVGCC